MQCYCNIMIMIYIKKQLSVFMLQFTGVFFSRFNIYCVIVVVEQSKISSNEQKLEMKKCKKKNCQKSSMRQQDIGVLSTQVMAKVILASLFFSWLILWQCRYRRKRENHKYKCNNRRTQMRIYVCILTTSQPGCCKRDSLLFDSYISKWSHHELRPVWVNVYTPICVQLLPGKEHVCLLPEHPASEVRALCVCPAPPDPQHTVWEHQPWDFPV